MTHPNRLESLTGLRFLAALLVVFYHTALTTILLHAPESLKNIVSAGYVGVSLFFVLSGFILMYVYFGRQKRTLSLRHFWWARFARVVPLYLVALAIAIPFFLQQLLQGKKHLATLLLSPLMLQAWVPTSALEWNPPGWSLSVEAFFYLLFPIVGLIISHLSARQALGLIALCGALLTLPALAFGALIEGAWTATEQMNVVWLNILKFNPLFHLGEFVIGAATGQYFLHRETSSRPWLALPVAIGILLVMWASPHIPYILLHDGLLALPFALLIYLLAGTSGGFLASRPMVLLGEGSYALYLLHAPMLYWCSFFTAHLGTSFEAPGVFWVYLTACLVMSLLAYHWVERPARNWLNSWFAKRYPAASAPITPRP